MEIIHNVEKNQFELWLEQREIGTIEYEIEDTNYIATVTRVLSKYAGKGYAEMLLDALVEYVKKQGKKIVPICPYVIAKFEKNPKKYNDVI